MRTVINLFLMAGFLIASQPASAEAKFIQTPYTEQKVVFDFYFDEPDKIGSALYWMRSLINPLMESPYSYSPEFMNIIVIIHGTEIVTMAKKNNKKYKQHVDRMKYYESLGVKFKICALAAHDFGYQREDFYDFVEVVPSAITELAHWQLKGYAVIAPNILPKKFSVEEIR